MASYEIGIEARAKKEFLEVPFPFRRQINQQIFRLKTDPRPEGADFVPEKAQYRIPVSGWWVGYEIDDSARIVTILFVVAAES